MARILLCISILACFLSLTGLIAPAQAWKPWNWDEANKTVECAAIYNAASYAVRNYKYQTNLGQSKQEIADHFQRLSNILRYFTQNSGHEAKMKEKLEQAFKQKKTFIDEEKRLSVLKEDIEHCDMLIDDLYTSYSE